MHFLVGLGLSLALTPAVRALAAAGGLVDRPADGLKIHRHPVPLAGVAAVAAAPAAVALLGGSLPGGVLWAAGVATAVGLVDDVRPLPAAARLLALLAAGGALAWWGGFRLEPLGPLAAPGVVLLVAATANAVNFTDGQDGLATGLAAIAAAGLATLAREAGAGPGMALAGALAGFLVWNRPPARAFLGNGGAYGLGALLAALAIPVGALHGWRGLVAAGVCLGVFVFELLFTVARRLSAGDRVFAGDRGHSYDLLAARAGRGRSTLVFWAAGGALAALAQAVRALPLAAGAGAAAAGLALALTLALRPGPRRPARA